MNNETDTWYVLADGTHAHPADVSTDEDGVMKHKNGVAVKMRDSGIPLTSGVPGDAPYPDGETREVKPEKAAKPAKGGKAATDGTYKTRESQGE